MNITSGWGGMVALMVKRGELFLFVQPYRPSKTAKPGAQIMVPGGKQKKGETRPQAAMREMYDETGVRIFNWQLEGMYMTDLEDERIQDGVHRKVFVGCRVTEEMWNSWMPHVRTTPLSEASGTLLDPPFWMKINRKTIEIIHDTHQRGVLEIIRQLASAHDDVAEIVDRLGLLKV